MCHIGLNRYQIFRDVSGLGLSTLSKITKWCGPGQSGRVGNLHRRSPRNVNDKGDGLATRRRRNPDRGILVNGQLKLQWKNPSGKDS